MKKNIYLIILVMLLPTCISNQYSAFAQEKPFPQAISYPGCIKPNHVSQNSMNTSVAAYYNHWKSSYLRNNLSTLPGGYYVEGHLTGGTKPYIGLGSSEGMGYGMVITALMAGHDSNAQTLFDGLFKTARTYKSSVNSNLMGWVVADDYGAQGHFSSATDGDMDIAYALVLAHYQWGSSGSVNYLSEAKKMINKGLKVSNITNINRLNVGDWDVNNEVDTRPSDWMFSHMRTFRKVTNDESWTHVINSLYNVYDEFSNKYSPETGLVSDFIVGDPVKPAPEKYLEEFKETNLYYYNAGRFPLRVVMDYAMYNSSNALRISNKLVNWIKRKTNNNPSNIKNGYRLDGTTYGDYNVALFTSPFIAASVANSNNQSFLNKGWDLIKNKKDSYFSDSYNMLCMLFISGNWWIPEANTIPTTPPKAPENLSSVGVSSNQVNLSWVDNSDNETGFQIQRSPNGSNNWVTVANLAVNKTFYSDKNLTASTTYYYQVRAENSIGASSYSNIVNMTTPAGAVQSPYTGIPISIPGILEVENFDLGGGSLAYNETSQTNQGGAYRIDEKVDIEVCSNGGYNVGWITNGEWLEYAIDVKSSGMYRLEFETASESTIGALSLEINDQVIVQNVSLPTTGGWQIWKTTKLSNVNLTTGNQILRIKIISGHFNLDKVTFIHENSIPVPLAPTNLMASVISNSQLDLKWNDNSNNETGFTIERSLNANTGWIVIANTEANITTYSDVNLTPETAYHYRVLAVNSSGNSTRSNVDKATTLGIVSNNLALLKPTSVSSIEAAGLKGDYAVDGDASTRWASLESDPQWIQVDLEAIYDIDRVKIVWEAAYGKDYKMEVSDDTATWRELKTVKNNTVLVNDHTGLSGTGRYLKISGIKRGTQWGYSIYELEVYGKSRLLGRDVKESLSIKNSPNPYDEQTTIILGLEKSGYTTIEVVNLMGVSQVQIHKGHLDKGAHAFRVTKNLPSGVYFCLVTQNGNKKSTTIVKQ